MNTETLTGKTRYREQKRFLRASLLVLQVEVHLKGEIGDSYGSSRTYDLLEWRDARIQDITEEPGSFGIKVVD